MYEINDENAQLWEKAPIVGGVATSEVVDGGSSINDVVQVSCFFFLGISCPCVYYMHTSTELFQMRSV